MQLHQELVNYLTKIFENYSTSTQVYQNSFLLFVDILYNYQFRQTNHLAKHLVEPLKMSILEKQDNSLNLTNPDKYINKILEKTFELFGLPLLKFKNENMPIKQNLKISNLKALLLSDKIVTDLEFCAWLILLLTEKFSKQKVLLANLNSCFEFMSFVCIQSKYVKSKSETIYDLYIYLKNVTETLNGISFNEHFIIQNNLVGYEHLLNDFIFTKEPKDFDLDDFNCLLDTRKDISNISTLAFVIKLLDSTQLQGNIRIDLSNLFWNIFDEVSLNEKILFILSVYENFEIAHSADNSIVCLDTNDLRSSLTIIINQISAQTCEDNKVIRL